MAEPCRTYGISAAKLKRLLVDAMLDVSTLKAMLERLLPPQVQERGRGFDDEGQFGDRLGSPTMLSNIIRVEDAPTYILVLLVVAVAVWLGLQFWKVHIQWTRIARTYPQHKRDAIDDAWLKIEDLKKRGLTETEFEDAKAQILATLENQKDEQEKTLGQIKHPKVVATEENRLSIFIQGITHFGFFGIWSVGWGLGWGMFGVPIFSVLWHWAFGGENHVLTTAWKTAVLLIAGFAAVGFWILPTVLAFLAAIRGFLNMVTAVRPNKYTLVLVEKLTLLTKKGPD